MKVHLEKAIFINRAPFDKLELDFYENEIAVLAAANGRGKTTILSHIVDAFYEIARPNFPNEFEGKDNKFYRISSIIHNVDQSCSSFVYFRFKADEGYIDYLDVRGGCTEEQYAEAILIENKIPFNEFKGDLETYDVVKKVSSGLDRKKAEDLFRNNVLTYFPSYRFEMPGYLNDPYKINLDFKSKSMFSGYLKNPIEIVTGLPNLANWLMDVVLDLRFDENPANHMLFNNLNVICTKMLSAKRYGNVRFGVGPRGFGGTRLQLLENKPDGKMIYPTIFNLSSGESSLLCVFGEILRQADNNKNNIPLNDITGIVLIDEIDKHLHIKLQKEILPSILRILPNVQFIVSSHSPFLNMGLAETVQDRSRVIDVENGLSIEPENDDQYNEVYKMMLSENDRYKKLYDSIKLEIDEKKELQIITEGKNTEHIQKAISVLDNDLLDKIKIISGAEDRSGDQQLKNAFDIMSNANHACKFLFVWDCDAKGKVDAIEESDSFYKFCFDVNENNSKTKKGIENLYDDVFFSGDVYDERNTDIEYGGTKKERKFNKAKFIQKIKDESNIDSFNNFVPLLDKIKLIFDAA